MTVAAVKEEVGDHSKPIDLVINGTVNDGMYNIYLKKLDNY